jgi:hypothetical protein
MGISNSNHALTKGYCTNVSVSLDLPSDFTDPHSKTRETITIYVLGCQAEEST